MLEIDSRRKNGVEQKVERCSKTVSAFLSAFRKDFEMEILGFMLLHNV